MIRMAVTPELEKAPPFAVEPVFAGIIMLGGVGSGLLMDQTSPPARRPSNRAAKRKPKWQKACSDGFERTKPGWSKPLFPAPHVLRGFLSQLTGFPEF
jgi:hypothetical protein